MTMNAPAEFQLHRRRQRDEQFGENIENTPPSTKATQTRGSSIATEYSIRGRKRARRRDLSR